LGRRIKILTPGNHTTRRDEDDENKLQLVGPF